MANWGFFHIFALLILITLDMNKVYDLHMTNEIKFHHLINSGDEKGAIELLEQCGDSINVNYKYNERIPVFLAINQRMYNLYEKIVNHHTFDGNTEDGFGETLLQSLLYLRTADEVYISDEDKAVIDKLIKITINCPNADLNQKSLNDETALSIACQYPTELLWVVEDLAKKENVNPNIIDDFGFTALTNAIRSKNIEAIKLLASRKDVSVMEVDLKEAAKNEINLADFGFEIAEKLKKAYEYAMT